MAETSSSSLQVVEHGKRKLRLLLDSVTSRPWKKTWRPWEKFISPQVFAYPQTADEARSRLLRNLYFFLSNYVAFTALVGILAVLSSPSLLFMLTAIAIMWWYVLSHEQVKLPNGLILAKEAATVAATAISGVLVFFFATSTIFMVIGISATGIIAHAVGNSAVSELEAEAALEREQELQAMGKQDPELGGLTGPIEEAADDLASSLK
eukprot:g73882.t1